MKQQGIYFLILLSLARGAELSILSSLPLCSYSRFTVGFVVDDKLEKGGEHDTTMIVRDEHRNVISVIDVPMETEDVIISNTVEEKKNDRGGLLTCTLFGETCQPSIDSISMLPLEEEDNESMTHKITVILDRPAQQLKIESEADLSRAFIIEPDNPPPSSTSNYMWSDDETFSFHLGGEIVSWALGGTLRLSVRHQDRPLLPIEYTTYVGNGRKTLRLNREGRFKLSLFDAEIDVTIENCEEEDDVVTIGGGEIVPLHPPEKEIELAPVFQAPASISLSGLVPYTLSPRSFPSGDGEFVLSLNVKLRRSTLHGGGGEGFRTLFFKGNTFATPNDDGTVTSTNSRLGVFLNGDNKLLVQCSTPGNIEHGGTSSSRIEHNGLWTHLTFVVTKSTLGVYVDGKVDLLIEFPGGRVGNDYPMTVGHVSGISGPMMEVSELKVFWGEVTGEDVRRVYEVDRFVVAVGDGDGSRIEDKLLLSKATGGDPDNNKDEGEKEGLDNAVTLVLDNAGKQLVESRIRGLQSSAHDCGGISAIERLRIYAGGSEGGAYFSAFGLLVYGTEGNDFAHCELLGAEDRNFAIGIDYLRLAVEDRHGEATYKLGVFMLSGMVLGSTEDAIKLLEEAIVEHSHVGASFALGNYHMKKGNFEASSHYLQLSAASANVFYTTPGNQPYFENHRLRDGYEDIVKLGQQGEDDAALQYTVDLAEQGDPTAMNALANLLYWGGRGFARDHVRARELWDEVGLDHDHIGGLCGAASMYIRGEGNGDEGGGADVAKAVMRYELAVEIGRGGGGDYVCALNGLGYAWFLGQGGLVKNQTKGFEYFLEGSSVENNDADSLTNAAHCYATGQGVEKDAKMAKALYERAAHIGSFEGAYEMGRRWLNNGLEDSGIGDGAFDHRIASNYLLSVTKSGEWGTLMRKGFDSYLVGDFDIALAHYAEGSSLGYPLAAGNAAYLLDHKLGGNIQIQPDNAIAYHDENKKGLIISRSGRSNSAAARKSANTVALNFHKIAIAASDTPPLPSLIALGDERYLTGDKANSLFYYSLAANLGSFTGGLYAGYVVEEQGDFDRAIQYYEDVQKRIEGEWENVGAGSMVEEEIRLREGKRIYWSVRISIWRVRVRMTSSAADKLVKLFEGRGGVGQHKEDEDDQDKDSKGAKFSEMIFTYFRKYFVKIQGGKILGVGDFAEERADQIRWVNVLITVFLCALLINVMRAFRM